MGNGLFDFAERNAGIQEPERERQAAAQAAETREDLKQRYEAIAEKKESILLQMEQGNAPQSILFSAVDLIGLCVSDPEWTDKAKEYLDKAYIMDELDERQAGIEATTNEARRLADQHREYMRKLKKQTTNNLKNLIRLESRLRDLERELDGCIDNAWNTEATPCPKENPHHGNRLKNT